jgi:DNA polymerase-3 subunit epsilon/ATP-dependent DNA helicase DinG
LPRTYVALDLETTGLSPEKDAIIEVGAVKFRDGEIVEEFATLVNPGRPIPPEITMITGITDRDVASAPPFERIEAPLLRFVGQAPVVGHNVSFDLGFLRTHGLLNGNVGLDTWELATIMLPSQSGYSLGALAARFDLPLHNAHRALDDATATGWLFDRLCAEAGRLPRAVLMEIARLAYGSDWPLAEVFGAALMAAGVGKIARDELPLDQLAPDSVLFGPWRAAEPLTPRDRVEPVDAAELAAMLRPDGAFSVAFPGYEFRPPQVDMLEAVADAFNQGHHLMVEAGTGTGKSVAYLLPAIAFAAQNNARVVVSTNTINLQDQLFNKDLPDLQRVLGMADPKGFRKPFGSKAEPFRAALLKGRSNYLCPRRFSALRARPNLNQDELRGVARILVWLPRTQTGDQGELSLPLPSDRSVWGQVSAENEGCSLDRCQREMGGRCFFFRARKQAEAAHVVVVNHALLMADAATENRVLPEYRHLVIDEAHHLEDAVTDQLSFKADGFALAQLFNGIYPQGGRSGGAPRDEQRNRTAGGRGKSSSAPAGAASGRAPGLLAEILTAARAKTADVQFQPIRDAIIRLQGDAEAVHSRLEMFWEVMDAVVRELVPRMENSDYDLRFRVTEATRSQPVWVEIEVAWDNLGVLWSTLLRHIEALGETLRALPNADESLENLIEQLGSTALRLVELQIQMEQWVMKPDPNSVYWVEVAAPERQGRRITLRAAPVHVGKLVQENVLYKNETVIMTSATLRTAGSFDYVRDRLSAQDADTATVGSPFNYPESTLLYLPTDLPEPNAPGYQTAVEQTLIGLAKALGGRTLALFTSYQQLKRTAQAIGPALTEASITMLSQGSGSSRHQILETFKAGNKTVLLGTRSFWEGVDVVGAALSALVLVRLPFAVPNDPVVAARSETFDDPFYGYQVPDAILRFRQGFGRLIRSKTDRGVVVVLDKRLTSKGYGRLFLESLPECTTHKGPLLNLPATARSWVER